MDNGFWKVLLYTVVQAVFTSWLSVGTTMATE
jgi:hypothetical protein